MSGYDLHTHTVMSDGTTTVEDNVAAALELGLEGLAITDHDTTAGHQRALEAARGTALEVIPGTELSAELDGASVHVLGYWPDPGNDGLQTEMDRLRNERARRAEAIVERLHALDVPVELERVRHVAGDAPIGRPHIAGAVVDAGAADSVQEVFDRWLHDGGPAYVPKYAVDPVRAVELITAAGGVAVLAHPGLYADGGAGVPEEVVRDMAAAGLAGIEADHPDHDPPARSRYREMAGRLQLVVTAGSDFHGTRKDNRLGEATTAREQVEALRARRP